MAQFVTAPAPIDVRPEYSLDEDTEHIGRCLCRLVDGKIRLCVYCCIKQLTKKRADIGSRPNFKFADSKPQHTLCFYHTYYRGVAEVMQPDCEECWQYYEEDYEGRSDEERAAYSKSTEKWVYDYDLGLDIVEEYFDDADLPLDYEYGSFPYVAADLSRPSHLKRKPKKTRYRRSRANYTIKRWNEYGHMFEYGHFRLKHSIKVDPDNDLGYEPWDPAGLRRRKDERDRRHFSQELADYFAG